MQVHGAGVLECAPGDSERNTAGGPVQGNETNTKEQTTRG